MSQHQQREQTVKSEKRQQLAKLVEEDRMRKLTQRVLPEKEPCKDDFFASVFAPRKHQSYDRSARNDKFVSYITDKFYSKPRTIETPPYQFHDTQHEILTKRKQTAYQNKIDLTQ